jgi:methylated-DNA-[protein]-cysteine S-methyltransferase
MPMTSFEEKIIKILDRIPRGKVITYTALAKLAGRPNAVRAVANAVGKNPHAPKVPCHRVIRSDGTLGGYSSKKGIPEKIRLLKKEGVIITKDRIDLTKFGWRS